MHPALLALRNQLTRRIARCECNYVRQRAVLLLADVDDVLRGHEAGHNWHVAVHENNFEGLRVFGATLPTANLLILLFSAVFIGLRTAIHGTLFGGVGRKLCFHLDYLLLDDINRQLAATRLTGFDLELDPH